MGAPDQLIHPPRPTPPESRAENCTSVRHTASVRQHETITRWHTSPQYLVAFVVQEHTTQNNTKSALPIVSRDTFYFQAQAVHCAKTSNSLKNFPIPFVLYAIVQKPGRYLLSCRLYPLHSPPMSPSLTSLGSQACVGCWPAQIT